MSSRSYQPDSASVYCTQFGTKRIVALEQNGFKLVAIDRSQLADGPSLRFTIYKYII
jgi:hypothetical protein